MGSNVCVAGGVRRAGSAVLEVASALVGGQLANYALRRALAELVQRKADLAGVEQRNALFVHRDRPKVDRAEVHPKHLAS